MGSLKRWRITNSREAEAAVTAVTQESSRQAACSRRRCSVAMERRAQQPLIHAVSSACLADERSSRPTVGGGAVTKSRRVHYSSSLRHCHKRECSVLAAGTLTWLGVLQGTACSMVGAAAAASAGVSAAARRESSSEEVLLRDVLPALPYHGLLSPWIWFICLSSFFLLHGFCKQILLWLRRERRGRTSKLALLLQSRVFPVHGLNRALSTLHALVALNWGVLVLLERYSSAGSAESQSAAAIAGARPETAKKLAGSAAGVSGVHSRVSEAAGPPVGSKTPSGGTAASVCAWGFGEPVTSQERALLLFSLSYFIYDTCYEGLYGTICDCVHHGAAVVGLLNVLGSDTGARDLIAALVVGELSTPLLHLRYYCIHFAKRLTAVAASSGVAAPSVSSATRATASRTLQQAQNRQQGDQQHSETAERRGAAAVGDSDKESDELSANVSPASTASTALPSGSLTRSTASRSTPRAAATAAVECAGCSASTSAVAHMTSGGAAAAGLRTGVSGTAAAPSQTATVTGEDGRPRARGHSARGFAAVSDAATPAAVAAACVAGEAPLGAAAGDSHGRRAQAAEGNTVPGTDAVAGSAAAVAGPALGAAATGGTAAECSSMSARSRACIPRLDAATVRSAETYSRSRVRNETFVRSGPNVRIPTPDLAATTGAAAILAAALGTAVAAAALGAAAPAGIATTAAVVAASCSFIFFSVVLRLSQRGGDPNSMFATSFHIPAGYVYPPSPRSQPHSAYGSADDGTEAAGGSPAAAAARAAALAQEQEEAAAAFLKRSGERVHSWIDGVEKSFFLAFVIGRAVLAPCVVYACVTCPSTPVLVRASGLLVLIVSCYWLFLLFKHAHNRKHRKAEKKEDLPSRSESHSAAKERTKNTTQVEGRDREGAQRVG